MRDNLIRFGFPFGFAIIGMILYQVLVSPIVLDALADWEFLHAARIQAIQQMQKAQQGAKVP